MTDRGGLMADEFKRGQPRERGLRTRTRVVGWAALVVTLAAVALVGCGGSSSSPTTTVVVPGSPAAPASTHAAAASSGVKPAPDSSKASAKASSTTLPRTSATTSARPSTKPSASSATSSSSGEIYSTPGAFSISSPAFALNGEIPAQYTCAGAGISPPLSWERVPAHAVELLLFVIDDTSDSYTNPDGGIRWVVGGIDPSSTGVAAGQVPAGGIVGTSTAGKAAYSPICPAPGKSDRIEFTLYALSKKIHISPGFSPTQAEHEYGSGNDLLGQSAVTYGIASRP